MGKQRDLTGIRFGRLVPTVFLSSNKYPQWECKLSVEDFIEKVERIYIRMVK